MQVVFSLCFAGFFGRGLWEMLLSGFLRVLGAGTLLGGQQGGVSPSS